MGDGIDVWVFLRVKSLTAGVPYVRGSFRD